MQGSCRVALEPSRRGWRKVEVEEGRCMFCDRCGTALTPGAQVCGACGKAVGAAPIAAPATAARPVSDGRVQRHIQLLATLWLATGVLRFVEVGSIYIAGRMLPFL